MKKLYIKPEIKGIVIMKQCLLLSGSEPASDWQDSKENSWEDFEITPLYDKTWGTGDNTWNEEEE